MHIGWAQDCVYWNKYQKQPCFCLQIRQFYQAQAIAHMLQRRPKETRSMYRSVKYRLSRDKDTRTADPSSCNFRIKRNSCIESTMAKTYGSTFPTTHLNGTLDLSPPKNNKGLTKPSYLQSFNSMIETNEKNINKRQNREVVGETYRESQQANFFRELKESKNLKDRITIPDIWEKEKIVQESEHHLLAPFNTPFSHVKLMAKNAQAQLTNQQQQAYQLKASLKNLEKSATNRLNDLNKHFLDQCRKFRGRLRKNEIEQQQRKLKTKRQIEQLMSHHHTNYTQFKSLDSKSSNLQVSIFNSTPYNLEIVDQFSDAGRVSSPQPYGQTYRQRVMNKIKLFEQQDFEEQATEMFYV